MPFSPKFLPQSTKRLTLRRFIEADLEQFLAYRQDAEVARFQSWSMLSEDEARAFIREMNLATMGVPGDWFQIAMAEKQSNLLVGDIGLCVFDHEPTTAEMGFTLAKGEQGKGYAQEAVRALLDSLFVQEHLTKIVCITDMRNKSSINLLTRLGMTLVHSEEVMFKNEWCIEHTFELVQGLD